MEKCSICDKEFESKTALGGHTTSVHSEKYKNTLVSKKEKKEELEIRKCKKCGDTFEILENKANRFCSRKCSNSRIYTEETRQKVSKSLTKFEKQNCKDCDKQLTLKNKSGYCIKCEKKHRIYSKETIEKLSSGGRKGVLLQKVSRRSKNEIAFANLCLEYFKEVKCNEQIFNGWDADIVIEDLKIAVLWNGKWHYEKITEKHSVEQVQNRDRIKLKEIEN